MHRRRMITIGAAGITGLSVVMGMAERREAGARESAAPAAATSGPLVMPPAVVVAKHPTLSEIVSLILKERPTAAELTRGRAAGDEFPRGSDEAYVAGILARRSTNRPLVHRIASSLVKEGRRRNIETQLLVGVLLTENPWLDPRATSSVGARGLMQVMPFHAGKWGCPSGDLFNVESNICHGVAVLADNLSHSRTLPQALLGYNGCVRGTNTPDCWKYPRAVYRKGNMRFRPGE